MARMRKGFKGIAPPLLRSSLPARYVEYEENLPEDGFGLEEKPLWPNFHIGGPSGQTPPDRNSRGSEPPRIDRPENSHPPKEKNPRCLSPAWRTSASAKP